jgi:hypothetical protein
VSCGNACGGRGALQKIVDDYFAIGYFIDLASVDTKVTA